jgi:K+/H+ antiporter YhaU regulatory subunit KhtT
MDEVKFELRGLKSDDMFPMFGILSKIGFKDLKNSLTPDRVAELTSAFQKQDGSDADMSTYLGFNIMVEAVEIIMKNLPSCKMEIYTLLSSLSGMTVKQIADLDMVTFTEMIIAVVQKEEFKDFFKVVAKLFK